MTSLERRYKLPTSASAVFGYHSVAMLVLAQVISDLRKREREREREREKREMTESIDLSLAYRDDQDIKKHNLAAGPRKVLHPIKAPRFVWGIRH